NYRRTRGITWALRLDQQVPIRSASTEWPSANLSWSVSPGTTALGRVLTSLSAQLGYRKVATARDQPSLLGAEPPAAPPSAGARPHGAPRPQRRQPPDADAAFPGHRFASYAQCGLPNGIPGERRAAGQPQDLAARDHRIRRAPHQRGADPMRKEAGWGRWWGRLPFVLLVACQARGGARGVPREFDGGHAFSYLQQQMQFGPRIPNTPAHERTGVLGMRGPNCICC